MEEKESKDAVDSADAPDWLIPDKVYDILKWIGLVVCPALALCVGTVAQACGVDAGTTKSAVTIINAVGVFVGMTIGASQLKANGTKGGDADE